MGLLRGSRTTAQRLIGLLRQGEAQPPTPPTVIGDSVFAPTHEHTIAIELAATLAASGSAAAYVRVRNAATGAYATDTGDSITVKDTREVGYNGVSGAKGAAIVKFLSDGTRYGELVDLECP